MFKTRRKRRHIHMKNMLLVVMLAASAGAGQDRNLQSGAQPLVSEACA